MAEISNIVFFLFFSLLFGNYVVSLNASHHHIYKRAQTGSLPPNQPYRTGYHFQPPKNWMNDPNGPMLYKGIYHLFYQHNPNAAIPGIFVWGHSTSTDLVNWVPHPPAFSPSEPYDAGGCWSGSATILADGRPVILYTGVHGPNNFQTQNLAEPKNLSDPFLVEWTKSPANPLMAPTTENGINATSFRDPTTAWLSLDGRWHVIIGSKIDRRGLAIQYTTKDFITWTESSVPLHSYNDSGMWECPDFYPVARFGSLGVETSSFDGPPLIKHILKVSLDDTKHDYYTIGTYDRAKDVYIPDEGFVQNGSAPRYDYGKYYASKTFFDPSKRRRILWGWVNESSSMEDDVEKGWSGLEAIPRKIWLDISGKQLIQWPIKEIEKLRTTQVNWPYKVLQSDSILEVSGITASQADVEVWFRVRDLEKADEIEPGWTDAQLICSQQNDSVKSGLGPFGLMVLASKDLKEYTSVYFRIFKDHHARNKYVVVMCSDQSRSSLEEDNDRTTYGAFVDIDPLYQPLSLRTLIDHSIVESFGGRGKACITSRVYPKLAIGEDSHLHVFNNGSQSVDLLTLNAWTMKPAHIN